METSNPAKNPCMFYHIDIEMVDKESGIRGTWGAGKIAGKAMIGLPVPKLDEGNYRFGKPISNADFLQVAP